MIRNDAFVDSTVSLDSKSAFSFPLCWYIYESN